MFIIKSLVPSGISQSHLGIFFPVFVQLASYKHRERSVYSFCLTVAVSMTMIYNLLNFPAGVVPVSTVTAEDEEELGQFKGNFQDHFDKLFKKVINVPEDFE